MKLETTERPLSTLEKERPPGRRDSDRPRDVAQEQQQRAQVGAAGGQARGAKDRGRAGDAHTSSSVARAGRL